MNRSNSPSKFERLVAQLREVSGKNVRIVNNYKGRDGTAGGKSQIVRTPLRVKHDSVGKPDWIFFAGFESIYGRARIFK